MGLPMKGFPQQSIQGYSFMVQLLSTWLSRKLGNFIFSRCPMTMDSFFCMGDIAPPKLSILHAFAPQKNQQPGDLCNKIRLLPLQSACAGRFCLLGMTSSYVVDLLLCVVCQSLHVLNSNCHICVSSGKS